MGAVTKENKPRLELTSNPIYAIINFMELRNYIGRTFNITYRPATAPDGSKNKDGEIFTYRIAVDSPFKNLTNGEEYAGFAAKDAAGSWHRFRWDRILKMIPISDEIPRKSLDLTPQTG